MTASPGVALRAWLHRRQAAAWHRRGVLARLLLPLTALHWCWRGVRGFLRLLGYQRPVRVGVPVIVVGNLTVGGTGKTPLVAEISRALQQRGWKPGIVSRGYGGELRVPALVDASGETSRFGDEPVLLRHLCQVPVAVGRDRVAAARLLLSTHRECNVLLCDDGLQHRRLARDVELCLVGEQGFGNGWLLPSGPLRDPPSRMRRIDAAVLHGVTPPVRIESSFFRMQTRAGDAVSMADPSRSQSLDEMAREQKERKLRLLAICAIGNPGRYFSMLRGHGLSFSARALPDHQAIDGRRLRAGRWDRILVTEKDAVKCARDELLARDSRIWVVPLLAHVDAGLFEYLDARLKETKRDGYPTA
jgi:tetraacyldisaccharide 4'-kinase